MALATERRGTADLLISDDGESVAAIAGPDLTFLRFRLEGPAHISGEVPLPLHWRQYANHQDPDRNAGQNARIEQVAEEEGRRVLVVCSGRNGSGAVESQTTLELIRLEHPVRYELVVRTLLRASDRWHVTPNPNHGELEFCTLFPVGAFSSDPAAPKRYQVSVLQQGGEVWKIPHHHLESADKHNIPLHHGGRFLWLLEDENPCVTLLSARPVEAGLCAYMWDGHFGYRVCGEGLPVALPPGSRFEAAYRLSALGREEGSVLAGAARPRPAPGIEGIPLYCRGLNRFDRNGGDAAEDPDRSWPWEFEILRRGERCEGTLDRSTGADDNRSLRITGTGAASGRWIATTIGPAYGEGVFADNARYRLEALVRTRALSGRAELALRLHRTGKPGLFDPSSYEVFRAARHVAGDSDWTRLELLTPSISPAPDRVHLLMEHNGDGISWFDNVLFEERP